MKHVLFLSLIILLFSTACEDDSPAPSPATGIKRVIVTNEGQFNASNASISIYYPDGDSVQNEIYSQVNGFGLGDILQSAEIIGGQLFALMNNSGRVEIMDRADLTADGFVGGLTSPRYILPIDDHKAYVSDLFGDISIIDPQLHSLLGTIATEGVTTGEMLLIGTEAYICYEGGSEVKVFDTTADAVVHSFDIARTPVDVLEDADGKVWMLFTGTSYDPVTFELIQEQPHLVRIDPSTKEILTDVAFDNWNAVQDMALSADGTSVVVLKENKLMSMSIEESTLADLDWADLTGNYYGRLSIDPENDDIYLANAGDFQSPGTIQRYSASGTLLSEFGVGVAPNGAIFD